MMPFFIIFLSLICSVSFADVEFTTKKPATKEFTLKKSCDEMGYKHVLLATALNQSIVDCMGKKLDATKFCKVKFAGDPRLLRGFVKMKEKSVVCHFADSAILTIPCSRYKNLCVSRNSGCEGLKSRYAHNLDLVHSSISSRKNGDFLRCYYAVKSTLDK